MPLRPEDHEGIRQLYGRYALAVDDGDIEGFVACFTPDATWRYTGLPESVDRARTFAGHEDLRALVTDIASRGARHMLHIVHLQTIDGDGGRAQTVHYGEVLRRGQTPYPEVILTDVAEDELVHTPEGWRFAARMGHVDNSRRLPPSSDVLVAAHDSFVSHVLDNAPPTS